MKLYDCRTAPSPRRVRIFAAEKGIALQLVPVDLANGEQYSAAFRAINPDCVVPVLELDDATRISEVLAICHYLEELQRDPPLIGRTAIERAQSLMWNAKVELQGLWATADAFRNTAKGLKGRALPGPDPFAQIPELAERSRHRVELFLQKLDSRLGDSDFVAGDFYSIADISALVVVDFAAWIKIGVPDASVNLHRWYTAVSSRPSATA